MRIDRFRIEDHPLRDVFLEQGYFRLIGQACSDFLSHITSRTDFNVSDTFTEYSELGRIHKDHQAQLFSEWPIWGLNPQPWCLRAPFSKQGCSMYRSQRSLQVSLCTSILIVLLLRSMSTYKDRTNNFPAPWPNPLEVFLVQHSTSPTSLWRPCPKIFYAHFSCQIYVNLKFDKKHLGVLARCTKQVLEQNEINFFYLSP